MFFCCKKIPLNTISFLFRFVLNGHTKQEDKSGYQFAICKAYMQEKEPFPVQKV